MAWQHALIACSSLAAAFAPHPRTQRLVAPLTAKVQIGDYLRLDWAIEAASGAAVDGAALPFDLGEVKLVVGAGNYLAALHANLVGCDLEVDEEVTFRVPAAQAFGERDARLGPLDIPAANAPAGMQAGDLAGLEGGRTARVLAVDAEKVVIDANHVLAGEDLDLRVRLLQEPAPAASLETATFAGGCFWGVELEYQRVPGVAATFVGYAQGQTDAPTYESVCSGATGHTEAVRVLFDPAEVSYERLCTVLMDRLGENRYALNRVGNDQGTQYRHGIYTHSPEQASMAAFVIAREQERDPGRPIVTEVEPAAAFYDAEAYHMQYLQKGGQSAKKNDPSVIRCYG
mmetsp:Transcript_23883/g.71651  ORF Transcript_23883/g.71651 Transcript_23883/m.71651 type:complete len:344 (+) Transcript_23883:116-1147(+)